jgi:hypothetical protein
LETAVGQLYKFKNYSFVAYVTDSGKKLKTKIIRVDDNYFVVFVKNIPEGFIVLSTTIFPKYIHPEIEVSNDGTVKNFV